MSTLADHTEAAETNWLQSFRQKSLEFHLVASQCHLRDFLMTYDRKSCIDITRNRFAFQRSLNKMTEAQDIKFSAQFFPSLKLIMCGWMGQGWGWCTFDFMLR